MMWRTMMWRTMMRRMIILVPCIKSVAFKIGVFQPCIGIKANISRRLMPKIEELFPFLNCDIEGIPSLL
jgi:hypothetical protein